MYPYDFDTSQKTKLNDHWIKNPEVNVSKLTSLLIFNFAKK